MGGFKADSAKSGKNRPLEDRQSQIQSEGI